MSVLEKIPELKVENEMFVSGNIIRHFTDDEFIELWMMPNKIIHCTLKTKEYIEDRRRKLGLIKTVPDSM